MTTEASNSSLRRRAFWVALVVGVPIAALAARGSDPRPVAFGWQMFSSDGDRLGAVVTETDGTEHRVDVDSLFFNLRAELRPTEELRLHLCQSDEFAWTADAVTIELGTQSETFEC